MRMLRAPLIVTFVLVCGNTAAPAEPPPAAPLPDGVLRRLGTVDLRTGGYAGAYPTGGFAISPDGKQAATVALSGRQAEPKGATLQLWDLGTGRLARSFPLPAIPVITPAAERTVRPGDVTFTNHRLMWSPDGKSIVVPQQGYVYRYDTSFEDKPTRLPLIDESTGISCIAFGRDGGELFAISTRGEFAEYQPKAQEWVRHEVPMINKEMLFEHYFIASGKGVVAFGGDDGRIRLWSPEKKEMIGTLELSGPVVGLQVSSDGTRVAACATSATGERIKDTAVVWGVADQKRLLGREPGAFPFSRLPALSPDGSRLALAVASEPNAVLVYDTETGKKLQTLPACGDELRHMAFLPDGSQLLAVGTEGAIHRWDAKTGKPVDAETGHRGEVRVTVVLKDGRTLTGSRDGVVCLWDADGKEVRRFTGHVKPITALAASPDGKTLFAASSVTSSYRAWNLADGKLIRAEQFDKGEESYGIHSVAVSPDGKTLALGFVNGIRLVDAETGKPGAKLTAPDAKKKTPSMENRIEAMRFRADGRLIAMNFPGTIRVWDVEKEEVIRTIERESIQYTTYHFDRSVYAFAVSPDEKTVAIPFYPRGYGPNQLVFVGFWDLESGKEVGRVEVTFQTRLTGIAYTPDGKSVLVGDERNGRIWQVDVEGKKVVKKFDTGRHFPRSLAVYPDGKSFVSGGTDATALVWKLDLDPKK